MLACTSAQCHVAWLLSTIYHFPPQTQPPKHLWRSTGSLRFNKGLLKDAPFLSRIDGILFRDLAIFFEDLPVFLGIVHLQVSQQALESLLVGVVVLPAAEVADVALAAQLGRPRLACSHHRFIESDWE